MRETCKIAPAMSLPVKRRAVLLIATFAAIACLRAAAQVPADQSAPEISSHDAPATFSSSVNLIVVPVVVRDKQGHTVETLRKEDFQVFDNGKPQAISKFSAEHRSEKKGTGNPSGGSGSQAARSGEETGSSPVGNPDRFILYMFDDLHLEFADLARARTAAGTSIQESLAPQTRIALFTTSGVTMLDFTDDAAAIQAALARLKPRGHSMTSSGQCPAISFFMADAIVNRNDGQALQAEVMETQSCTSSQVPLNAQRQLVMSEARGVLNRGEAESRTSLLSISNAVRRLSTSPGDRSLVLVSPGFLTPELLSDVSEVIDRAIQSRIAVSSVDARGLYITGAYSDASKDIRNPTAELLKSGYDRQEAEAQADLMGELADGTGGTFFHNNNDLLHGLRLIAIPPETSYVLGYSNPTVRPDGKFHTIKVKLRDGSGLAVQARRGYFAPAHSVTAEEESKSAIQDAVFSRDQTSDFPIHVRSHFFKTTDVDAKVSVVIHVDIRSIRFVKAEDRQRDTLTAVAALFDRDGNYVAGKESTLQMRFRDETLTRARNTGVTLNTSFDVKVGAYLIRTVVRDSEGRMVSTSNDTIEIP